MSPARCAPGEPSDEPEQEVSPENRGVEDDEEDHALVCVCASIQA